MLLDQVWILIGNAVLDAAPDNLSESRSVKAFPKALRPFENSNRQVAENSRGGCLVVRAFQKGVISWLVPFRGESFACKTLQIHLLRLLM